MRKQLHGGLLVLLLHCAAAAQPAPQAQMVINGQVLDDEGRPAAGAIVNAHYDGGLRGRLPTTHSDGRGNFTLVVRQPGNYVVGALLPNEGHVSPFNPFYNPSRDSVARVSVAEGAASPFAAVRLRPKAGVVAGLVADAETGRPVAEFQVTLCRAEAPKYCHGVSAKSRGGRFLVPVPQSAFTLRVSSPGYKDWHAADGPGLSPATLQVASGATREVRVTLERLAGRADSGAAATTLDAPQPLLPADGAEFDHGHPRTTRLEWSAVPGAASYTVELEVCLPGDPDRRECRAPHFYQHRDNPPLSGIEGTSYEFIFTGAQPGRWRVWAVDAGGRPGAKSAWTKFIYTR